ncbi:sialic acid synthase NeuB [Odoribacter sp. CAG:788]|jgi:pseudaminic acid synthase|nr:sialic acid synthase NeuB [Odoribacter sp. CAG:788]
MGNNNTFIIAEISANHNHDFDLTVKTIKAIADTGADAVKVQTYKADSLALDVDNEYFGPKKEGLWKGIKPYDLYKAGTMPYEWQPRLKQITEELGLVFFSTPFDFEGVDFLEKMGVPMYKIASFEINDIPLIRYAAQKGKPMIISTGLGDVRDIELAIDTCKATGNNDITLLKCTSQYPATLEQANLMTIPDMAARFKVKVGVSDHTMGNIVPIVAVSLGARVVEKHFILDRTLGGPDAAFSVEPLEFKQMVKAIRDVELALGGVKYEVTDKDKTKRRSLFVTRDISKGDILNPDNVKSLRPGNGLAPVYLSSIYGKTVNRDLKKGDALRLEYID